MRSANKLLVTNAGALKAKYAKKYSKAEDAIQGLIKADATAQSRLLIQTAGRKQRRPLMASGMRTTPTISQLSVRPISSCIKTWRIPSMRRTMMTISTSQAISLMRAMLRTARRFPISEDRPVSLGESRISMHWAMRRIS
jgi:hypothetical protein